MQEAHEINQMIKKLRYIDLAIGIILMIITYIVNKQYVLITMLGFILAIVSFYVNTYIVKYSFSNTNLNTTFIIKISYFCRVFLVGIIGVILFNENKFNIIAYVLGYTFRFFSLIFYALLGNNAERG